MPNERATPKPIAPPKKDTRKRHGKGKMTSVERMKLNNPNKPKRAAPNPPPAVKLPGFAGRPPVYNDDFCEIARRLALLGMTDPEMAAFFGVSTATLHDWANKHEKFYYARLEGKEHADATVAEKLYHRAIGYSHEAVKIFMPSGAKKPVYAPYTEHFPPDVRAIENWLWVRQPKRWKNMGNPSVMISNTLNISPPEDTAEARKRLVADLDELARPEPLLIEGRAEAAEEPAGALERPVRVRPPTSWE